MNKLFILLLLLAVISCKPDEKNISKINPYFDTAEFVKKEIDIFANQNIKAKKTISYNEKSETKLLENISKEMWEAEFMLLKDANFNKPALLGFYSIDTTQNESNTIYKYKALNNNLRTQYLTFSENDFIEVVIEKANLMNSYKKTFIYKNHSFIGIQGWEKSLFGDTIFFYTEVVFLHQ